jgi:hypothetical protein
VIGGASSNPNIDDIATVRALDRHRREILRVTHVDAFDQDTLGTSDERIEPILPPFRSPLPKARCTGLHKLAR